MPGTFDSTAGFGTGGELLGTPKGLPNQRLTDLTPDLDVGELSSRRNPGDLVSTEEPDAQWAIRQLNREKPKVELWRTEGRRAMAFFDGDQISDADKSVMEASGRPTITLNDTRRFIKIVDGIERRVPLSVFYVARNPEDVRAQFKAEMRTKAKEWAYDTCGATFEIARAKHDRNVCGMGWTESFISRANNPAGIIEIRRFSPFEAIFPSSSRENLLGTKWRARKRKMPVEAAIQKWPRVADILMSAAGGEGAPKNYPVKADLVRYRVPWIMTEPTNKGGDVPPSPEEVSVTDFQYTKATEGYYFKDIDGQYDWLPTRKFNLYSKRLAVATGDLPKNAEKVIKDVYWRLFLLNDSFVLDEPAEMPIDGFSLNCITGDYDEKRKMWYGMVRLFIDPQLLVDKLASSAVEIIGAQTKGGIDVEIGAMSEPQAAEYRKTASTPGAVNWFKRNALAENRTRPKAAPAVPEGTIALLQFGMQAMQTLSGLTESLLAPGDSSGVGLRQRLSMGLLLLADYFDSSARFEREQADMTQKFMSLIADDRWVRIGGPGNEQAVRLAKDDFDDMLDTTIDDTEQDPTLRRLYMDKITELAPVLIKTNNFTPELLDWFLLPVQFREKLKQAIKNNAQQQMQMRMMGIGNGRGKSRTPDEVKADTMKVQGQAALSFAKAQHLKAQADNLGKQALSNDLKDIMDALIGAHKADLEERKHAHQSGIDRVTAGTALYSAVNANRGGGQ